ncbi:L-histidine N(alpha)-methyltransferase [Aestuariirhabdus sp. Z084]|uniref:L-histidine N(alpha)-methyltransferase n=1 Tax=Aestuariirhabdus haliotis TaxID=2918751 RepID=UPI00201B416E|nr:L-histidine N(alpha)-methyltransferase [Aestuariirhabdus haliotis]MCL6414027.1 L-histidine N(alpha)-methyltransferase [Aestuariirhabdus haliotis]MCL6417960.1 L-histidine N(alpha)-methyltransferase [Aestuariirhabdus haliotis]
MTDIHFYDEHSARDELAEDIITGLNQRPASIPPKYFYDAEGSVLFDAITQLPEYYPTRTEIAILTDNARDIADQVGSGSLLVEPGCGSCAKVRILLEGLRPLAYVPMDISGDHLRLAAEALATDFPWLEIHASCTDYSRVMRLPPSVPDGISLAFFPGSSIGNFDPADAINFLTAIAHLVGQGGYLLIGVDRKKSHQILQAAYDDKAGITARFNLNLLTRINRQLGADFNLNQWRHQALYNELLGRIEMHLVSRCPQRITLGGRKYDFAKGETIHTENSYKYHPQEFIDLAARAGFAVRAQWSDHQQLFSVLLFQVETPAVSNTKTGPHNRS